MKESWELVNFVGILIYVIKSIRATKILKTEKYYNGYKDFYIRKKLLTIFRVGGSIRSAVCGTHILSGILIPNIPSTVSMVSSVL